MVICLMMAAAAFADSSTTTATINPNDTVKGSFTDTVKVCEYTLDLAESGKLELDIHNDVSDSIGFSGPASSVFSPYIQPGDVSFTYELAPGQYTISFDNKYGPLGDFSMSTKFTPSGETYTGDNNSVNLVRKSDALPFNKMVTAHIAANDTSDCFKLDLPSSGKLTVDIHSDIDTLNLEVIDDDNSHVTGKYISKGDETLEYELTKGTYYLMFDQTEGYGNFNFKPTFKSADETYQFENETVNLVRSKKAIPFATVIKGHMALNDTADCFKVSVPKAGKYSIKVTGAMENIYLKVTDKKDAFVSEYFHKKGTKTYTVTLKKGNNYLLFKGDHSDLGNYSFKVTPSKVSIRKLTKASKSTKVTWTKGTGDGYQIQYSTDKNFKKNVKSVKLITNIKTTSKTIKSLKSKKTYYVRIRTYVKSASGKKVWSDWSKAKSIKVL